MLRKGVIIFCLGVFAVSLYGEQKAGYKLLDSLVFSFQEMAASNAGGYEEVNAVLQEKMKELKAAKSSGEIDPVFFMRYKRMLEVLKLAIIDTPYDPEGILNSLILREVNRFVTDVTGEEKAIPIRGIGAIAGAIVEEILNLHIYLDNKTNRTKLSDKYRLKK